MFGKRRVKPLLDIHGTWVTGQRYPETLHVAMGDGRIVRYHSEMPLVKLNLGKDGWKKTGREVVGYQYKKPKRMTSSLRLGCYL